MIIHIAICDGCSRRDEMDLMPTEIRPPSGTRWLLPLKWLQKSVYQAPDQHFCSRTCAARNADALQVVSIGTGG